MAKCTKLLLFVVLFLCMLPNDLRLCLPLCSCVFVSLLLSLLPFCALRLAFPREHLFSCLYYSITITLALGFSLCLSFFLLYFYLFVSSSSFCLFLVFSLFVVLCVVVCCVSSSLLSVCFSSLVLFVVTLSLSFSLSVCCAFFVVCCSVCWLVLYYYAPRLRINIYNKIILFIIGFIIIQ